MRVLFVLFLLIVFTILGGVHYYLQRRFLGALPFLANRSRRIVQLIFALLAISFPAARLLGRFTWPNALVEAADWFAAIWLGMALYFFISALFEHLLEFLLVKTGTMPGVVWLMKGRQRLVALCLVVGSGLALSGVAMQRARQPAEITKLEIPLPRLPSRLDGFQIAHLTDLHMGMMIHAQRLTELVEQVNALKPDVVVITGDLVDEDASYLQDLIEPLRSFRARYGVLAVSGNHDFYAGIEDVVRYARAGGVGFLRNESVLVAGGIRFWGLDDRAMRRLSSTKQVTMEQLFSQQPSSGDHIDVLLYHQPLDFEKAHHYGIDLMLSGHTHGGQTWPIQHISNLIYPRNAGLYQIGNSYLYVSRGTGTWGPPMRLGAPPEIALIKLRAVSN